MYTVIIVDDEPAAIQYLSTIIEKRCPQYQVVAVADDAKTALALVEEKKPDVLLFDIQMPVMNGLEMSAAIKRLGLPVIMIVVSGYSEFEYARLAMENGARNYLLKPVAPQRLQQMLEELSKTLEKRYYEERVKLLRQLYHASEVPEEALRKYFGNQRFWTALVRRNGFPMRFSAQNSREVFSDIHELLITYGRDEMENLYLCPVGMFRQPEFEEMLQRQAQKESTVSGYSTTILSRQPVSCDKICGTVKKLYHVLDCNVILGRNRRIHIEDFTEIPVVLSDEERNALSAFQYYIGKKDYEKAKKAMERTLRVFDEKDRGLLWVEREIRGMYLSLAKVQGREKYDEEYMENEYAIEEAFSTSVDLDQLINSVQEILFREAKNEDPLKKLDTEEFIGRVRDYVSGHLESIEGAQDLCQRFNISQTYLGKLFRRYQGMAVSTYLTQTRVEKAKEMIRDDPELLIKDVAERLGYRDQFYFSRVFRSYTGVCPSEFIEGVKKKKSSEAANQKNKGEKSL